MEAPKTDIQLMDKVRILVRDSSKWHCTKAAYGEVVSIKRITRKNFAEVMVKLDDAYGDHRKGTVISCIADEVYPDNR